MKAGGIMHKVKISVRRLAEFMLKSGDIDRSIGAVSDAEAMAEGRKIHKKIQKLAGPDYRAEVTLKTGICHRRDVVNGAGRDVRTYH